MKIKDKLVLTHRSRYLWLLSPYNVEGIELLKSIGGKWDGEVKQWYFPNLPHVDERIITVCKTVWGEPPVEVSDPIDIVPTPPTKGKWKSRRKGEAVRETGLTETANAYQTCLRLAKQISLLVNQLTDEEREVLYERIFVSKGETEEETELDL